MLSQQAIDLAGLALAGLIGVATSYIAWMQTRIAREQNSISTSLMKIEEHRDEPHLIVRSVTDLNLSERPDFGDEFDVKASVEIQNVGGSAAWNIKITLLRIYASAPDSPDWDGDDSNPVEALPCEFLYADVWFDLLIDTGVIEVLQPSEWSSIEFRFRTKHCVEELLGAEVLAGLRDDRGGSGRSWKTFSRSQIMEPTEEELRAYWSQRYSNDIWSQVDRPVNEYPVEVPVRLVTDRVAE